MMGMKRNISLIIGCVVAALAAAIGVGIYVAQTREKSNSILSTDGAGFAVEDIPQADPLMVGRWQNTENPLWYKVYLDDYDDEGFFWGKEWDESEDVREEDLAYHGNGWFLWKTEGDMLTELHTMDVQNAQVPKVWRVHHLSSAVAMLPYDSLILVDKAYRKHQFHFIKLQQY